MPDRVLKDNILTCEKINQLSPGAEIFFRRLLSVVDDNGVYEARTDILLKELFPLRTKNVGEECIAGWKKECQKVGLLVLWNEDLLPLLRISSEHLKLSKKKLGKIKRIRREHGNV